MNVKEDLDSQRTLRSPLLGKQVATLAREDGRVIEDFHLSSRSKVPVTSPALQQTTYYGFLLSAPFRRLSRSWWNTVLFSHLRIPHSTPSQPTHLSVSPQYLDKHFTWNPQWLHLAGSQKNYLACNAQPTHSPKNQRRQQNLRKETPYS